MNIKIYSFKLLASLVLILIANLTFAQDQTIPMGTPDPYHYSVDTDPAEGGKADTGTDGSTYAWTITYIVGSSPGPGVIGTFPTDGEYNDVTKGNTTTDNKATINWSLSTPGDYEVKVVETNGACPTDETKYIVRITSPSAIGNVSWTSTNVCKGDGMTFNVTGAIPNSTLHYSATNTTTATATGTVLVDASGNATINVVHDGSTNNQVVITLDKLVLNGIDIPYTDAKPTATATINIVQTSPIKLL
ncbi:hypothetical protein OBK22_03010 [Empedobacter falsenii]